MHCLHCWPGRWPWFPLSGGWRGVAACGGGILALAAAFSLAQAGAFEGLSLVGAAGRAPNPAGMPHCLCCHIGGNAEAQTPAPLWVQGPAAPPARAGAARSRQPLGWGREEGREGGAGGAPAAGPTRQPGSFPTPTDSPCLGTWPGGIPGFCPRARCLSLCSHTALPGAESPGSTLRAQPVGLCRPA